MRGLTAALGVAGLVLLSWTYPGALVLLAAASHSIAGLAALGVSWGFGDVESLLRSGAESVCGTVRELGEALDERLQSGTNTKRCQRRSTT